MSFYLYLIIRRKDGVEFKQAIYKADMFKTEYQPDAINVLSRTGNTGGNVPKAKRIKTKAVLQDVEMTLKKYEKLNAKELRKIITVNNSIPEVKKILRDDIIAVQMATYTTAFMLPEFDVYCVVD